MGGRWAPALEQDIVPAAEGGASRALAMAGKTRALPKEAPGEPLGDRLRSLVPAYSAATAVGCCRIPGGGTLAAAARDRGTAAGEGRHGRDRHAQIHSARRALPSRLRLGCNAVGAGGSPSRQPPRGDRAGLPLPPIPAQPEVEEPAAHVPRWASRTQRGVFRGGYRADGCAATVVVVVAAVDRAAVGKWDAAAAAAAAVATRTGRAAEQPEKWATACFW